ncbi:spermidine/putrescine ABC transporter ATP-binding subunit [Beggiatoa alba B18LD]|uniref:Spermidine/putrescine import ATP-binding protein PotA n=1 Tax=Beggiatoa alba B18LD TaxID=395493 RepID=I3CC70_9GAMM|nr:polyamine ABC transporter ATP-binding protein [Beggiatoa alba]EIJ41213.1 spermidine/putrescine ABC transporter ATP-binding subunit [Beggiatoa alba B18LD]
MAVVEEDPSALANDSSKPISPSSHNANYIRIENVTKTFDKFVAVDNVSLTINKGEIFALLGSSGCGKSTLLRMLAGFEVPTEGKIYIDGQDMSSIPPYLRPVNMMFQSYALFPHLTVAQNIEFGLKQDNIPKAERLEQVAKMLELVRMSPYAKRKPHQLSGGQKQRVALARSLAKKPKLLLLDEPMGALDKKLRGQMQLEVVEILERVGVTCVMVTHDQEEAMTMAGRIGIMDKGRLLQIGAPSAVYETPNSRFTAEFIGSANMFEGILIEDEPDYVVIDCPTMPNKFYVEHGITGEEGMQVWVAIRPEKISILTEQPEGDYNWAKGIVHDIAYLGSHSIYYINLDSGKRVQVIVANQGRFSKLSVTWKDEVYISWHSESMVVLTS